MKKITILALHLGYGGIERTLSMVANSLVENYDVEIVSTYKIFDTPRFKLNNKIKVTYLIEDLVPNRNKFLSNLKSFKLISTFKEGIKALKILYYKKKRMIDFIKSCDSDVIISTRDIHNLWLGEYGSPSSLKIGWEHNYHNNNEKFIRKIVKSVEKLDYFVLVSKELNDFYSDRLSHTNVKCVFIPNGIDYISDNKSDLKSKNIISVGRLSHEKGFLDLIDVFKMVSEKYSDWKLNIIGDGNEKEVLEKKVRDLNLQNNIKLLGFKTREEINELLLSSSIYVMSSYTESFGIVLLEAFSFGVPAVAFNSAKGACEIIKDNWDGYLIDNRDKELMVKRICELISNYNRRFIMGSNAYKKSLKYNMDSIKEKWIDIIEKR